MKYSTVLIALAATISAESIAGLQAMIPKCAQACLASAVAASGCSPSDFTCQCGPGMAAIRSSATDCITKTLGSPTGCSISDALTIQPISEKICTVAAVMPAADLSTSQAAYQISQSSDGQVVATTAAPASSAVPLSQSSDGQVQATTAAPKPSASSAAPYASGNGTYSTVYTTVTHTITSCAPTVTACPVGKVTTETVSLYTTFCLYSSTYAAVPSASSAKATTAAPSVQTPPAPVNPPASASVPVVGSNSTMVTIGKATPTTTPVQVTGAASSLKVGGFLGAVVALAAFVLWEN